MTLNEAREPGQARLEPRQRPAGAASAGLLREEQLGRRRGYGWVSKTDRPINVINAVGRVVETEARPWSDRGRTAVLCLVEWSFSIV